MEVIYFELNDWSPGRDHPNAELFVSWLSEHYFRDEEWVKKDKWFIYCLLISAIPVIRLSVAIVLILMAIYPEKESYEMIEKSRNKRNK